MPRNWAPLFWSCRRRAAARHFLPAGSAPRAPDVDHDDLAGAVVGADLLARHQNVLTGQSTDPTAGVRGIVEDFRLSAGGDELEVGAGLHGVLAVPQAARVSSAAARVDNDHADRVIVISVRPVFYGATA